MSSHNQPTSGWIGRRLPVPVDGVARTTVGLLPERLREGLKRANYELAAVLPGWEEMGALVAFGKGRTPYLPIRQIGDSKARIYVFAPGTFDGPDEETSND